MLNLLLEYRETENVSDVSGIPPDWKRSAWNKKQAAAQSMEALVENIRARFLLISFNSEGFISLPEMTAILEQHGKVDALERKYNTFRGSQNLSGRTMHVKEYLYLLEKTERKSRPRGNDQPSPPPRIASATGRRAA